VENVVVVTLRTAAAAHAVLRALVRCSGDEGFRFGAGRVVYRDQAGWISDIADVEDGSTPASDAGATIGAFLGLFSGPLALLLGGATGALVSSRGHTPDRGHADTIADAIVSAVPPESYAVVAVVTERSPAMVNRIAAARAGRLVRRSREAFELELASAEEAVWAARQEARRVLRRHGALRSAI
jgi:uncharacterized membrane protein